MANTNIYNLIIVDQSGSMFSIYDMALSSLNETIQTVRGVQKENPQINQFISIAVFSGEGTRGVKLVRDRVPITNVKDLTKEDYRPDGCTPLYDAIGSTVTSLKKNITKEDKVMVTIITDGYENSSTEYNAAGIRSIIEILRSEGWTFGFIGANQDAVLTAKELNINNALNFECTDHGVETMSAKLSRASMRFANFCIADNGKDYDKLFDDEI